MVSVIKLSIVTLSVVNLKVIVSLLSVIVLSVIIPNVVAPFEAIFLFILNCEAPCKIFYNTKQQRKNTDQSYISFYSCNLQLLVTVNCICYCKSLSP
jgi:hypothetical protein